MTEAGRVGVDNMEKLQSLRLDPEERAALLATATECVFAFAGGPGGGWPSGVVVSFMHEGGSFWITAVRDRRHVTALAEDPRVTIVVSNLGTATEGRQMLSVRGVATVHSDPETRDWMLPRLVAKLGPANPQEFLRLLQSPNRVVIEVRPVATAVSHDSRKLPGDGRGGPGPG